MELANKYASFNNEYFTNASGTIISVVANLTLKARLIPPGDFTMLTRFLQEVKKAENEKFIIIKN